MARKNKKSQLEFVEPKLNFFNQENNETSTNAEESVKMPEVEELKEEVFPVEEKKETDNFDEMPNISSIFEVANNNILHAKNIFNKNIEMKKELDSKFEELEQKQKEFDRKQQEDYEKIKK